VPNVPNLIGVPISQAVALLTGAGLQAGTTGVVPSKTIQVGGVVSVNPSVNQSAAPGTSVDMQISSGPPGIWPLVFDNLQSIFFNVLAAVLLIFFMANTGKAIFLKDTDAARGLITFIITVTAAGLFIIMAISTVVLARGADDDKRFDRGKQVLTMLIGILGTIVGFYFGAAPASPKLEPLKIADLKVNPAQAKKSEKFTISASVSGGTKPYTYSISFEPPSNISPIKDKPSPDGKIKEEVTVPADLAADTDVAYTVIAKDSDNNSKTAEGDKKISLKVH